ncbi:hypothetical protein BDD12DRAFT_886159 [Trichophaea hybrida]|nr:hypothetical protein BDD12DRAFT_886159 [Trichophaea hybrida]
MSSLVTPLVLAPRAPVNMALGRAVVPSDFDDRDFLQSMCRLSGLPDLILTPDDAQRQDTRIHNIYSIVGSMFSEDLPARPQVNYPPQVNGQAIITNPQAVHDALMFGNPDDAYQYVSQPTTAQVQAYSEQLLSRVNTFNNDILRAKMRLDNIQSASRHAAWLRKHHQTHGMGVPPRGSLQPARVFYPSRGPGHLGGNRGFIIQRPIPNMLGRRPDEKELTRWEFANKRKAEKNAWIKKRRQQMGLLPADPNPEKKMEEKIAAQMARNDAIAKEQKEKEAKRTRGEQKHIQKVMIELEVTIE